ncbi:MAG: hypothetical protein C5S48_09990 [Candidatus Methanogaster sp.]|nr:MAG: hypothetical protein C5S48_09990 [ANME-2 cluster archaeon]
MNYGDEDVKNRSVGRESDHGRADTSMREGESEEAFPDEQETEEFFERIEKKRKIRMLLGVLSLSISFGLFASANFLVPGMLDLTIAVRWVLLILPVILFALGVYFLVYHPIIVVEEEEEEEVEEVGDKFVTISGDEYIGGNINPSRE